LKNNILLQQYFLLLLLDFLYRRCKMQKIKKIFAQMGFNTANLIIQLPVEELEILHI